MNYLPYAGYWFYGTANAKERASYMVTYGLFNAAPEGGGAVSYYAHPIHPIHPIHPNYARMGTGILMLWVLITKLLGELK